MHKNRIIISFILPTVSYVPDGGFKIVYEYANRLCEKGYSINIIHTKNLVKTNSTILEFVRRLNYYKLKVKKKYYTGSWFPIDKKIKNYFIPYPVNKFTPDADVVIATAWQTAKPVLNFNKSKGQKLYFIQSLENWAGTEKEVIETWKYPLKKIVISKWLRDFAGSINEDVIYIPNGLDYSKFNMDVLPEQRNPKKLLMLLSNNFVKGSKYGITAINKLKEIEPEIEVSFFGANLYNDTIPEWAKFYRNPNQNLLRSLYNEASVFLSPSLVEGFPLPPAEAMMCGSALVASDIGGHTEYAINEYNSLLFPPKNIDKNVECLLKLINNQKLRCKLALKGYNDIQKYKWDDSVNMFETLILDNYQI